MGLVSVSNTNAKNVENKWLEFQFRALDAAALMAAAGGRRQRSSDTGMLVFWSG